MNNIVWKNIPLSHEIIFNEEAMSISFSLCPEADNYLASSLAEKNFLIKEFERHGFSRFISPRKDGWGFGEIFKLNSARSGRDSWVTWECLLPRSAKDKKLSEIAGSINVLTTGPYLFNKDLKTDSHELQLMMIDDVRTVHDDFRDAGSFAFSYSKEVLDFCREIWKGGNIYYSILDCMKKTYQHLMGRDLRMSEKYSFSLQMVRSNPRVVSFYCPGENTWVSVISDTSLNEFGATFSSHNVDTKVQQLTLLAGAIKIANLARQYSK